MGLRHLAVAVVLILILNAGITYGIVQWASPGGAQGPQGMQGIPGPVATADANATLCAAALGALPPGNVPPSKAVTTAISKYCP
jgi:hypothetical protein